MHGTLSGSLRWVVVAALTCGVGLRAQTPAAQLRVSTAKTTFHVGERISLELDFTGPAEAHLGVVTSAMDRAGSMNHESFDVSPSSGSSDPLAGYLNGSGFGGSFVSGVGELSLKPVTMHVDLNQWVRFDSPGDYTVTVHSTRVFRANKPFPFGNEQPVTSNAIKLHIIAATPEWQKAMLAHAVQTLALKRKPYGPVPEETAAAIGDIRYLGTPEAVAVMAAGLSEDQSAQAYPFTFGLIGLPPSMHELAIRALRERIDEPEVAVSGVMMMALSGLEAMPAGSPEETVRARGAAREAAERLAIAALPRKTGKAKAATASLLLSNSGDLTGADKAEIVRALGSTFTELPEDKQALLLQWDWALLRPVISVQALQQIASLPVKDAASRETPTYNRVDLKSSALSRLYEVDPEAAKRVVYAQIGSEKPSLTAARLWFLPAEPLPEFEAVWAQALFGTRGESNPEVLAGLMTRFGTGEFASQVAAKVRASLGEEACAPQEAMLAYVVKFNADLARPLLHDALEARSGTRCYSMVIGDMPQYTASPVLTEVAIEGVDDADPQTAMSALRYLMVYGEQRAQAPILKRYREWTQEWAGRGDELEGGSPFRPSPNSEQEQLGEMLGRALLVNQGWIADDRLRAEVLKRCVGEQMCRMLQQQTGGPAGVVSLFQHEEREMVTVGPYEIPNLDLLKAKLSQYPRGTAFSLIPSSPVTDQRFEQQVRGVFDDAGMSLTEMK